METILNVRRWGNSAGVLLPREWLGSRVKISIIESTKSVKEEIFSLLDEYMDDILGIYLAGSYARQEQGEESDIDVIVFSNKTNKEIVSGKYHISVIPLEMARKSILEYPINLLPRLAEAKALLNSGLLDELKGIKVSKKNFEEFIKECKRIIKINEGFIKLDKEDSDILESESVIYSLVLRLRGVYLMNYVLANKKYYKQKFEIYLAKEIGRDEEKKVYSVYTQIRDDKKTKERISIKTAQALLDLLKKEIKRYGK